MSAIQFGYTTEYSIKSPQSQNYLSIDGDTLTISPRSGNYNSVPITIEARNIKPDGTELSNDEGSSITFTVTFAPDLVGDENDNTIDGTSGNDIYNVTDGYDVVDGKSGVDTIVIPSNQYALDFFFSLYTEEQRNEISFNENTKNWSVVKSIDVDGSLTGIAGKEFLYIFKNIDPVSELGFPFIDENYLNTELGDKYFNLTIATNFEKIFFENTLYDYEDFISTNAFVLNLTPSIYNQNTVKHKKQHDVI